MICYISYNLCISYNPIEAFKENVSALFFLHPLKHARRDNFHFHLLSNVWRPCN